MYIRQTTRKRKDGGQYICHLLVESVRTPKGPRQRVVCSLGDLGPKTPAEWLKLVHSVESALAGQSELWECKDEDVQTILKKIKASSDPAPAAAAPVSGPAELVSVRAEEVRVEEERQAGPAHVGRHFWNRLGLDQILADAGLDARSRMLACAMTLNRLADPGSEHRMPGWIRNTALGDILSADFAKLASDSLYRNLDRLHPQRALIEASLARRERDLFSLDPAVFFYDLTSTYFEGEAARCGKARRGYSRDKRPDCKQVVIGLAVGREGFPIAHEVFDGNLTDRLSLDKMLDAMNKRSPLNPGQTVVVDRGMSFDSNIEEIKKRGLHYVLASRQSERDQWLGEFEGLGGFEEVSRGGAAPGCGGKPPVKVLKRQHGEEWHVLCVSDGRKEKDRAIRVKHESKLRDDLAKLERRIAAGRLVKEDKIWQAVGRLKERHPRVARYYDIAYDAAAKALSFKELSGKKEKAEQLDGSYLLKTDRGDLGAQEAWLIYSLLTKAESAFRNMKTPLAERPIFHQLERRVETHIFLCVLAFHLLCAIERTLAETGCRSSWSAIKDALSTHMVGTIVLPLADGSELRIRKAGKPNPEQLEIYKKLGVDPAVIPAKRAIVRPTPDVVTSGEGNQLNQNDSAW